MRDLRAQWWLGALIVVLLAGVAVILLLGGSAKVDRATAIEQRLRCPVCKSVSIADSPSTTAASMRQIVGEQVAAGRSDSQIVAYFTDRYGQWILLDPPVQGQTLLLWLLPGLAAALGVLLLVTRPAKAGGATAALPDLDRRRVEAALREYAPLPEEDDEP